MFHKFVLMIFHLDNPHKSTDNDVKIFKDKKIKFNFSFGLVFYLCDNGFLPGSVGGLQAPTN
jgi:hypothetical protein